MHSAHTTTARATELLHAALGPAERFRDGQLEAFLALVDERARVLIVQRRAGGRSSSTSSPRHS
jgi:ATP-dependent DNA helicase RecQ